MILRTSSSASVIDEMIAYSTLHGVCLAVLAPGLLLLIRGKKKLGASHDRAAPEKVSHDRGLHELGAKSFILLS
ncbi:MAG: hypothetical protein EB015_19565 [Methylocystaceae bacterium]|nr:hypothetical protein [Methylocystaceae bacterium]